MQDKNDIIEINNIPCIILEDNILSEKQLLSTFFNFEIEFVKKIPKKNDNVLTKTIENFDKLFKDWKFFTIF